MNIGSVSYVSESAVHVLWESPVYATIRNTSMGELDNVLGGRLKEFSALNDYKRTGFVVRIGRAMILRLSDYS